MAKSHRTERRRVVEIGLEILESRCLLAGDPMLLADLGDDGPSNPTEFVRCATWCISKL
jgi:hypothetical protein